MRATSLVCVTLVVSALSCAEQQLSWLQQNLANAYPSICHSARDLPGPCDTSAIRIQIYNRVYNNAHLVVTFSSSSAAELPDSQRASLAREVGEHVFDHYWNSDRVRNITITFVGITRPGLVGATDSTFSYSFTTMTLWRGRTRSNAPL